MKQEQRGWASGVIWLAIGVLCWCMAASLLATWDARLLQDRIGYRDAKAAITMEDLRALRKEIAEAGGGHVTGWSQQLSGSVAAKRTAGSAQVDILWADGNTEMVFAPEMVLGQMPAEGDDLGCAIDLETALKLYGTADVVGLALEHSDREMEIRGVFALPEGLYAKGTDPGRGMMLAAPLSEDAAFTALEFILQPEDGGLPSEMAVDAMRRAGLSTGGTWLDDTDGRTLAQIAIDIPLYLLVLLILLKLAAAFRRLTANALAGRAQLLEDRLTPAKRYIRLLFTWACGAILLLGAGFLAMRMLPAFRPIPPAYMPTQWSDFGFWPDLLEKHFTERANKAFSVQLRPDMLRDALTGWLAAMAVCALFCFWRGNRLLKQNGKAVTLMRACAWFLPLGLSLPAALWICARAGCIPAASPSMAWLPCLLYLAITALTVGKMPDIWIAWGRKAPLNKHAIHLFSKRKELTP